MDFHEKCDKINNTLTLVRTQSGFRFGGFTAASWEGINVFKPDKSAFIFSLDKKKCYNSNNETHAIWCYPNYGPIFEGYQIDIFDNFLIKNWSKTGKKGVGYDTTEDYELNNGEQFYIVKDIEVYTINT